MFCSKCGKEIADEAVICTGCGCMVNNAHTTGIASSAANQDVVQTISQRIHINGIIWIVIAALQLILGICGNWTLLIVGVLNLVSSIQDINYSKTFPSNPVGIVAKMTPLTGPIITLVYNLVIGGVIGIAGSIYYFIAVRGYVMENTQAFTEIEALQSQNHLQGE